MGWLWFGGLVVGGLCSFVGGVVFGYCGVVVVLVEVGIGGVGC